MALLPVVYIHHYLLMLSTSGVAISGVHSSLSVDAIVTRRLDGPRAAGFDRWGLLSNK